MVEREIDVVHEIAVGLCLVSCRDRIHISHGHKAEQRLCLPRRNSVEVIFVQIQPVALGTARILFVVFPIGAKVAPRVFRNAGAGLVA